MGEGVANHRQHAVFVEGGLPGDKVVAQLSLRGKIWRGLLLEVLSPGPARRTSPCPLSESCGGCDWLHLNEEAQRDAKRLISESTLQHIGGIAPGSYQFPAVILSPQSLAYRRRAAFHWTPQGLAFYARGSHADAAVDRCIALLPRLQSLPEQLNPWLSPIGRELKTVHLLGEGEQASVALFLKKEGKPKQALIRQLESLCAALKLQGAVIVPSTGKGRVILRNPIIETHHPFLNGVPLYLRPDAFAQANAEGNSLLVSAALKSLAPTQDDRVLELHSGNGNFTFPIASACKEVLGIESSPLSLDLANRSARQGKVENVRFVLGEVESVLKGLVAERARFDLLLLDPPRAGTPGLASSLSRLSVTRLVYVSCDIASLARDARSFSASGYRLEKIQLVDMFPQTHHSEVVASFTQN